MKKTTKKALATSLAFAATFATPALVQQGTIEVGAASQFYDMNNHWAKEIIAEAVALGYIQGYADGTFKPDNSVSNAEFIKMLTVALHPNEDYSTTSKDWYAPYVEQAIEKGLISANEFSTMDNLMKRSDLAKLSVRGIGETNTDERKWMYLAATNGLIKGVDNKGTLNENGNMTRAEAATVINRILKIKSGETLPADKYAVGNAEILWHKTNIFTVAPQWFKTQAIEEFNGTHEGYRVEVLGGNVISEVKKFVAIDLDDMNDPNRHLIEDKVIRFATPQKTENAKATESKNGIVFLTVGELTIKDTDKIDKKAYSVLTLNHVAFSIKTLNYTHSSFVYPENELTGKTSSFVFIPGQNYEKSIQHTYYNGLYVSKDFELHEKSESIYLGLNGITGFGDGGTDPIYTYTYNRN